MGTLIDSSVFIAAERGHPPSGTMVALADLATGEYLIAAITASELLHGIYRAKTEAQRLARTADVENILSNVILIPFDLGVARVHAQLDASLRATGNKVGANDLAIAATALAHGHDVMSRVAFRPDGPRPWATATRAPCVPACPRAAASMPLVWRGYSRARRAKIVDGESISAT